MNTKYMLGIVALAGLTACESAIAPDALDQQLTEDAAMVAADAALEDLAHMGIVIGTTSYEGAPPTTRSRVVTFFDENGVEQSAYNPQTTASMTIAVEVSGAVERGSWTASIERMRNLTVSGLLGDEETRIWNGTGSGSTLRSRHDDENGDRSYDMTSASTIADVVRGVPRSEHPWPLSGTITRDITVTITNGPNGDETRSRTVVIEFNGTQFAILTIGDETFEVDLAARDGQRAHRKR